MKSIKNYFYFIFLLVVVISCSQSTSSQSGQKQVGKDYSKYSNLADVLRSEGLMVMGSGNNIRVYLRGQSTIKLETQPLYVIDRNVVGNDYAQANNMINPVNIKSIRVIRDLSQVTLYGEMANNGVIKITTKLGGG